MYPTIINSLDDSTFKKSFYVNFMPISCHFYAQMPLRVCNNFLNMGMTPLPPSFEQCLQTAQLVSEASLSK